MWEIPAHGSSGDTACWHHPRRYNSQNSPLGASTAAYLAGRWAIAFGERFEVMNQGLHVILHVGAPGRCDLMVANHHRSRVGTQPLHTLLDDARGLAEFLDPHRVAVVTITIGPDRDVEVDLVVRGVWLLLAQIPGDPEPRSIGPVKPSCIARSGVTTPTPTVRCFQILLSVSRVSVFIDQPLGTGQMKSSMKSSSEPSRAALRRFARRYCRTGISRSAASAQADPGIRHWACNKLACIRAPDTAS